MATFATNLQKLKVSQQGIFYTSAGTPLFFNLSPDPPGQLHVLEHYGHPLGVNGAQVGVLEQPGALLKLLAAPRLRPIATSGWN